MKTVYSILISTILVLFMSACGGGGEDTALFSKSEELIPLQNCDTYTFIMTGDVVIQDEANTSIRTVVDTNNSKKACVLSGSAHIIRK